MIPRIVFNYREGLRTRDGRCRDEESRERFQDCCTSLILRDDRRGVCLLLIFRVKDDHHRYLN
jgi:hypothetical protein